ncbi:hypothetical protein JE939_002879 [Yersinia ruckeri]|nr:hypothetical protein [Yersinia ruckeri]
MGRIVQLTKNKIAHFSQHYCGIDVDTVPDASIAIKDIHELIRLSSKPVPVISLHRVINNERKKYSDKLFSCEEIALGLLYVKSRLYIYRSVLYISGESLDSSVNDSFSIVSCPSILAYFALLVSTLSRQEFEIKRTEMNAIDIGVRYLENIKELTILSDCVIRWLVENPTAKQKDIRLHFNINSRRFAKLVVHIANLANQSSDKLLSQTFMAKKVGLIKNTTHHFELLPSNLEKIEKYSSRLNEMKANTLNRVVGDFFYIVEKQQRLIKKNR